MGSRQDHSTFSKNRHGRFRNNDTLRFVFEKVLECCVVEDLVGGEGFAIDASVIRAGANRQRGVPGAEANWDRESSFTRPVREYLEALDATEEPRKPPKNVSLTDPAAQWTAAPGGPAFYAYSTNYLIDTKAGIVVDVEATPAYRTDEVNVTRTMVDRVENWFGIKPTHLIGDTAYGIAEMLGWMDDEKAIEPHVPVWDKAQRKDGTLGRSDFHWMNETDEYRCPKDKSLRSTGKRTAEDTLIYRSSVHDCSGCELKYRCCPNTTHWKIARQVNESARDVARELATTPQYARSRRYRKKVEMLFAHLKRILKLDRLRLRGLKGARDEFLLATTAQNLRRMAAWLMSKGQMAANAMPI